MTPAMKKPTGQLFILAVILAPGILGSAPGPGSPPAPDRLLEGGGEPDGFHDQEKEGYVPVEGGRIYYQEGGEGPPVVLIHGGYLDHRMLEALAANYRVVRYDVRSHGRSHAQEGPFSDPDDLSVLLDTLKIPRVHLVGLSLGGQIALDFAILNPDRVESLLLAGPGLGGFPAGSPQVVRYMEEITDALNREAFPETIEIFTRYWCDGPFRSPAEVDPDVRGKVLEMLSGSRERWGRSRLAFEGRSWRCSPGVGNVGVAHGWLASWILRQWIGFPKSMRRLSYSSALSTCRISKKWWITWRPPYPMLGEWTSRAWPTW